jgi:uncharacterized protein (DUF488 family)
MNASTTNPAGPGPLTIHTIGHSDHTTKAFVGLLRQYGITLVVDVRSQPYSRWAPHFNREPLARDLEDVGIAYQFMGDSLGGRPADPSLYEPGRERPDYGRLERADVYRAGVDRLLKLAGEERVAVMCSEGDHRHCHRHLLIAQTLLGRGIRVLHVQPEGGVIEGEQVGRQLSLF